MPGKLHCFRHAEGHHNTIPEKVHLQDPGLTEFGIQQCLDLRSSFPYHERITAVVSSPLRRTLQTALIVFEPLIKIKSLKIIALPGIQEASDMACDTGSDKKELEKEFAGQPVDLSLLDNEWNSKQGKWAANFQVIEERARVARCFLRQLASQKGDVAVVTHGTFLHFFTDDWSDWAKYNGTSWANAEWRTYIFRPEPNDKARIIELPESLAHRHSSQLIDTKQKRAKKEAERMWRALGLEKEV